MKTIQLAKLEDGWTPSEQEGTLLTLLRDGDFPSFRPNITLQVFPLDDGQPLDAVADDMLASLPQDGTGPRVLDEAHSGTQELPTFMRRIALQVELPSQTLDIEAVQTYYGFTDEELGVRGVLMLSYSALAENFWELMDDYVLLTRSLDIVPAKAD